MKSPFVSVWPQGKRSCFSPAFETTLPYYPIYEATRTFLAPVRFAVEAVELSYYYQPKLSPHQILFRKQVLASCELFERLTRQYGKPAFAIRKTFIEGEKVPVREKTVWTRPFCKLVHFQRTLPKSRKPDPILLIVAPLSGHHATLLRGTVEAFLPNHEVYITDWVDARKVPLSPKNSFDLDHYIDYMLEIFEFLGKKFHVMCVCQPCVPVFAAISRAEAEKACAPLSAAFLGGPVDVSSNPTEVNQLALENGIEWFEKNVITTVPCHYPGAMRKVYPGFLQLAGFMSMNAERHIQAHKDLYQALLEEDESSATKKREFYDEYFSVMDLTAEFYLQTIRTIFIENQLARGVMRHRDMPVDPQKIKDTALFAIEGAKDDITGRGQTKAILRLACNLPSSKKEYLLQKGVGHYGLFNGSTFRKEIAPRIAAFLRKHNR